MTKQQLAVFELDGGGVVLKLKANWADRKATKTKLKTLRSFKNALEQTVRIVDPLRDRARG